jgi:hypothetical protein
MKKKFWLAIVIIVIVAPVFSGTKEPISYVLFFDAGIPLKVDEGFSSADFGRSFLELAGQVRLAENFYLECLYTLYPKPVQNTSFIATAVVLRLHWTDYGNPLLQRKLDFS